MTNIRVYAQKGIGGHYFSGAKGIVLCLFSHSAKWKEFSISVPAIYLCFQKCINWALTF